MYSPFDSPTPTTPRAAAVPGITAAPGPEPAPEGGISPTLVALSNAIMSRESSGNRNALSPQGATGSMQIMPGTFQQYARPGESFDNEEHRINASLRKLADDFKYYGGDPTKTAAAYIGGRGAVRPDGTIRDDVRDALGTTPAAYASQVVARMGRYASMTGAPQTPQPETGRNPDIGIDAAAGKLYVNGQVFRIDDYGRAIELLRNGAFQQSGTGVMPSNFKQPPEGSVEAYFNRIIPSSDTGKAVTSGVAGYKAGMQNVAGAVLDVFGMKPENNTPMQYADVNKRYGEQLGAVSGLPQTWDSAQGPVGVAQLTYGKLLESLPYMAEIVATGGLGAIAKNIGFKGARAVAEEQAAKVLSEQLAKGVAPEVAQAAARAAGEQTYTFGVRYLPQISMMAGSYPSAVGDILGNQQEEAHRYDLASAAALGVPYAAANMIGGGAQAVNLLTRGTVRGAAPAAAIKGWGGRAARGGLGALTTGAEESVGEFSQEVLNQAGRVAVNPNASMTSPEALARYRESAIVGGLVGGAMGGAGGMATRAQAVPSAPPVVTPDQPQDLLQPGNMSPNAGPQGDQRLFAPVTASLDGGPLVPGGNIDFRAEPSPFTGIRAPLVTPDQASALQQTTGAAVPPVTAPILNEPLRGGVDPTAPVSMQDMAVQQAAGAAQEPVATPHTTGAQVAGQGTWDAADLSNAVRVPVPDTRRTTSVVRQRPSRVKKSAGETEGPRVAVGPTAGAASAAPVTARVPKSGGLSPEPWRVRLDKGTTEEGATLDQGAPQAAARVEAAPKAEAVEKPVKIEAGEGTKEAELQQLEDEVNRLLAAKKAEGKAPTERKPTKEPTKGEMAKARKVGKALHEELDADPEINAYAHRIGRLNRDLGSPSRYTSDAKGADENGWFNVPITKPRGTGEKVMGGAARIARDAVERATMMEAVFRKFDDMVKRHGVAGVNALFEHRKRGNLELEESVTPEFADDMPEDAQERSDKQMREARVILSNLWRLYRQGGFGDNEFGLTSNTSGEVRGRREVDATAKRLMGWFSGQGGQPPRGWKGTETGMERLATYFRLHGRSDLSRMLGNALVHVFRNTHDADLKMVAGDSVEVNGTKYHGLFVYATKEKPVTAVTQDGEVTLTKPTVLLPTEAVTEELVLHEMLHAATAGAMSNPKVRAGLASIVKAVKAVQPSEEQRRARRAWKAITETKSEYEATMELLSYGFTDNQFQQYLKTVKMPGAAKVKGVITTAFEYLVNMVKLALGVHTAKNSALARFVEEGFTVLRTAEEGAKGKAKSFLGSDIDAIGLATRAARSDLRLAREAVLAAEKGKWHVVQDHMERVADNSGAHAARVREAATKAAASKSVADVRAAVSELEAMEKSNSEAWLGSRKFDFRNGNQVYHKGMKKTGVVVAVKPTPLSYDLIDFKDTEGNVHTVKDNELEYHWRGPRQGSLFGAVKEKGGNWARSAIVNLADAIQSLDAAQSGLDWVQENLDGDADTIAGTREDLLAEKKIKEGDVARGEWALDRVRKYLNKYAGTKDDPLNDFLNPYGGTWEQLMDRVVKQKRADSADAHVNNVRHGELLWDAPYATITPSGYEPSVAWAELEGILQHVGDFLRLKVPAEKLQQYDLVRAVKETAKWDEEMDRERAKADKDAKRIIKEQTNTATTYREYPDGWKWVQLKRPGEFALESTLMAHSVRGYEPMPSSEDHVELSEFGLPRNMPHSGYEQYGHGGWGAIKRGEAVVYSLRDAGGQPHVTVEMEGRPPAGSIEDIAEFVAKRGTTEERGELHRLDAAVAAGKAGADTRRMHFLNGVQRRNIVRVDDWWQKHKKHRYNYSITQIKGKGNGSVDAAALPHVQDFVRSGDWTSVSDLHNTGLVSAEQYKQFALDHGLEREDIGDAKYVTRQQWERLVAKEESDAFRDNVTRVLGAVAPIANESAVPVADLKAPTKLIEKVYEKAIRTLFSFAYGVDENGKTRLEAAYDKHKSSVLNWVAPNHTSRAYHLQGLDGDLYMPEPFKASMHAMRVSSHAGQVETGRVMRVLNDLPLEKEAALDAYMRGKTEELPSFSDDEVKAAKAFRGYVDQLMVDAREAGVLPEWTKDASIGDIIQWVTSTSVKLPAGLKASSTFTSLTANGTKQRMRSSAVIEGDNKAGYHALKDGNSIVGFAPVGMSEADARSELGLEAFVVQDDAVWRVASKNNGMFTFIHTPTFAEKRAQMKVASYMDALALTTAQLAHDTGVIRVANQLVEDANVDTKGGLAYKSEALLREHEGEHVIVEDDPRNPAQKRLARTPGNWVKLKSGYGKLTGHYVPASVYAALTDYNSTESIFGKTYGEVLRFWKEGKTALNPGTHISNVMSNFVMMYLHDISPSTLRHAFEIMQGKDGAGAAVWHEFEKSGALLSGYRANELASDIIRKLEADVEARTRNVQESARGTVALLHAWEKAKASVIAEWVQKRRDWASDLYEAEDNVFRLAAYMEFMRRESGKPDGLRGDKAVFAAGKFAADAMINYNINARYINKLRGSVLPFLAWPYRAIPMIAKIALFQPWKIATILTYVSALNALAYAIDGGDEDEERKHLPEWQRGSVWGLPGAPKMLRLPFSPDGKPAFVNLSSYMPLGNINTNAASGIPATVMPGGPVWTAIEMLMGYNSFTGQPINRPAQSTGEKAVNMLDYAWEAWAPGIPLPWNREWDKLHDVWTGKKNVAGNTAEPITTVLSAFGPKVVAVDMREQEVRQAQGMAALAREFRTEIRRMAREGWRNNDSADEIRDKQAALITRFHEQLAKRKGEE